MQLKRGHRTCGIGCCCGVQVRVQRHLIQQLVFHEEGQIGVGQQAVEVIHDVSAIHDLPE